MFDHFDHGVYEFTLASEFSLRIDALLYPVQLLTILDLLLFAAFRLPLSSRP